MTLRRYYIFIILPLVFVAFFALLGWKSFLAISLLAYYIYRIFLDYYKLKLDKKVDRRDVWKFVVPLWSFIYFEELYLSKKKLNADT